MEKIHARIIARHIDRSIALMMIIIVSLRIVQLAWELRSSMLHASLGVYVDVVYVITQQSSTHHRSHRYSRHLYHR